MVSVLDALNKVLVLIYNVLPPNKIPRRDAGLFFMYCYCEVMTIFAPSLRAFVRRRGNPHLRKLILKLNIYNEVFYKKLLTILKYIKKQVFLIKTLLFMKIVKKHYERLKRLYKDYKK